MTLRPEHVSHLLLKILFLGFSCLGCISFSAIGSEREPDISADIEGMSDDAYFGGMTLAVARIASNVRRQMQQKIGEALPECGPVNALQGEVVATSIGDAPPKSKPQANAVLDELQAMLKSERSFVRDAAAFIIGEIGPAAASLEPDLAGHDAGRSVWFSHALGRVSCQPYSLGNSLDVVPAAARLRLLGSTVEPRSFRSKLQLVAKLLQYPQLQWPDSFFAAAIEGRDPERDRESPDPDEASWILAIADRLAGESTPMRLRLDLARLLGSLAHSARPASAVMWELAKRSDDDLAWILANAVVASGSSEAVDAGAMLLKRFHAAPSMLPVELCGNKRAAEILSPLLRVQLGGGNWNDAAQAASKLGCIDSVGSSDVLRKTLTHPSWEVQLAAIEALAETAHSDPRTREDLQTIQRKHWSGLVREAAEKALNPPSAKEIDSQTPDTLVFNCFHRCLTDHLRRCGDDEDIVDGLYVSPSMGKLEIEWDRARRIPQPAGFPGEVAEDSRPDYGTSTYLRVENGWLYGTDRWHYDGEIGFADEKGSKSAIGNWGDDAVAILDTPHFGIALLGGSLFGVGEAGLLASLEHGPEGWRVVPKVALPSPPWGWAFAPNGTLLVADPYEAVAVLEDGSIESLACPMFKPKYTAGSLLALAKDAPKGPSKQKQRELSDALAVRLSTFLSQRDRSAELTRDPGKREKWETPEVVDAWLSRELESLLEAYLAAGKPEVAIELINGIPEGMIEITPGRRFQLYAAAGRPNEARAQLGPLVNDNDEIGLKFHLALSLAQHRLKNAKLALARIDALHEASQDGNESSDPYLEILRWLATEKTRKADANLIDSEEWPRPILAYLDGKISEKALVSASYRRNGQIDREKLCEALFYMGLHQVVKGRSRSARAHFRAVVSLGGKQYFEYAVAATMID